jgi:hypothetical protein
MGVPTATTTTAPLLVPATTAISVQAPKIMGSVAGHVFDDLNRDGVQEPGEPNISGAGILVADSFGLTQRVTTDALGNYRAVVRAGSVRADVIEGTLPPGLTLTTGNDPQVASVGPYGTATSPVGYGPPFLATATANLTMAPTVGPTRAAATAPTRAATPIATPTLDVAQSTGPECWTLDGPLELAPSLELVAVTDTGELFFTHQLCITVEQPFVLLGARDAGIGFIVDDRIALDVERPDGTTATWGYDLSLGCTADDPSIGPIDLSALFLPGKNVLTLQLYDACDHLEGTDGPLMLSTGDATSAVQQVAAPLIAATRREPA